MRIFTIVLTFIVLSFSSESLAQIEHNTFHGRPDTNIISGHFNDALWCSSRPDASKVGVFIMVDSNYHHSVDDLLPGIMSYFEHYKIPAVFVKQSVPYKGKAATIRLYIGGKALTGDLSIGNFSLFALRDNHKEVFARVRKRFEEANSVTSMEH